MKSRRAGLILISVLLTGGVTPAHTRDGGSKESLHGLQSVFVSVHQNPRPYGNRGLTNSQIWSEIVVRLQNAGLKVLTEEEWEKTKGRPYLYLNLTDTVLAGQGQTAAGYVCTCSLDLMQEVALTREASTVADACTWSRGATIVVPSDDLGQLRMLVDNLASEFAGAVLTANKQVPSQPR